MADPVARLNETLSDRYRIERELGEGGMATVYLAHDLKHDRAVAIKVLKPELAAVVGAERFLAEIRTTANLQHPGILPLHDSGEADSFLFYVMPYVEGESLRDRLDREHQLPVDEAVRIATDVAEALEYAHQHGVIHRDVKPANILLVAGRPVLSDFGIALAVGVAGGGRLTETGLSLGTPHYMSPEQATGEQHVGPATDTYALGCVLYEMLTGDPPHTGGTAQAVLGKIITEPPPSVTQQRRSVPANVDAAIRKALEKLPADRFRSAGELAKALADPGFRHGAEAGAASVTNVRALRWWIRSPWSWGMTALAAAGLVLAVLFARRKPPVTSALPPFQFVLTTTDSVEPRDGSPWPGAISPDGGTVVYSAAGPGGQLMLYSLRTDELQAHAIPGTVSANQPYFSPDGRWLGFEQNGDERKVRLDGSSPVTVTGGGVSSNGATWTPGGQIVIGSFGAFKGLAQVSASGGKAVALTHVDTTKGERNHVWPIATPDPNVVVFTIWYGGLESAKLAAASLSDGRVTPLGVSGIRPLAVLDGHLVYVQADGSVMAVPFDVRHERVSGAPVQVHDRVGVNRALNGNSEIYISSGGALLTGKASSSARLVWKSRDGMTRPAVPGIRDYTQATSSPGGKRIAVVVSGDRGSDVWIWDSTLSTFSRLTTLGTAASVSWSRDGADVAYVASDSASQYVVWLQPVTGGSPPKKLFAEPDVTASAALSPDGKSLVVQAYRGSWDLLRIPLDSGAVARPYVTSRFNAILPRFSPDGKWVSYESDETGQREVYVRSFPDPSRKIQISTAPAVGSLWSADGSRLYYGSNTGGHAVVLDARVSLSPTFRLLGRDSVMSLTGLSAGYGLSPDGTRMLGAEAVSGGYRLVVSPNWITQLRRRLAASEAGGADGGRR